MADLLNELELGRAQDLSGQKFNRLTVVRMSHRTRRRNGDKIIATRIHWVCRCECGTETVLESGKLGVIHSCGCFRSEISAALKRTHGCSDREVPDPVYTAWRAMRDRCRRSGSSGWKNYGGRGITIDPSWETFQQFDSDMRNLYKPGLSLDRIDNNAGYSKSNCRWATDSQQANNRRTCSLLTHAGKTLNLTQWGEVTGFGFRVVQSRFLRGWEADRILTTPLRVSGRPQGS